MSDLISRQKVLNTLDNMDKALDEDRTVETYKALLTKCIKVLPTAKSDGDLISRERLINEWDDLGRRYAMPTTPIHKRAFREFPSADARENIPVKFIPINADCRGYADIFGCTNCGGIITVSNVAKELDYDFCPWCGGKAE